MHNFVAHSWSVRYLSTQPSLPLPATLQASNLPRLRPRPPRGARGRARCAAGGASAEPGGVEGRWSRGEGALAWLSVGVWRCLEAVLEEWETDGLSDLVASFFRPNSVDPKIYRSSVFSNVPHLLQQAAQGNPGQGRSTT